MCGSLISIGAFAEVVGVPASALRYYDEVGLLPPAHVDPVTGYRFYDAVQVRRARLVAVLRELGLSVAEMRSLLEAGDRVVAERLRHLAERRTADAGREAAGLRSLAAQLEAAGAVAGVVVDAAQLRVAAQRVAAVAGEGPLAALQLVTSDNGLAVLASDRYRLARWRLHPLRSSTADSAGLVPSAELEKLVAWLGGQGSVTCHLEGGLVSFSGTGPDFVCRAHQEDFPDLATVFAARAPHGRSRHLIEPHELDGQDEVIALAVKGHRLELSRSLVDGGVASLVGDEVLLLMDEPDSAVLLQFPGQPDHQVLVMPRQPHASDGTDAGRR